MNFDQFYEKTLEKIAQRVSTPQINKTAAQNDLVKVANSLRQAASMLEKIAGGVGPTIDNAAAASAASKAMNSNAYEGIMGNRTGLDHISSNVGGGQLAGKLDKATMLEQIMKMLSDAGGAVSGAVQAHPYLAGGAAGAAGAMGLSSLMGGGKDDERRRG